MATAKALNLSSFTEAYLQPLIVMSSPEQLLAATAAEASTAPEGMAPDVATGAKPHQAPVTGKLFGADDSDDLFGTRWGFIHPSLKFREEWTDNLYNLNVTKEGNALTVISPGIWLGLPRMEEAPVIFSLNNGAIGGHRFLTTSSESFERFQTYLSGGLDYKLYSANPDLNKTAWQLEAFGRYNMPTGLTLHILDNFSSDRDQFDRGTFHFQESPVQQEGDPVTLDPTFIRDYYANMFNTALTYSMAERYTVSFDYTNFALIYDDDADAWMNRMDNNLSLSISYHYSPKTSFVAEYSRALVSYEQQDANNNTNNFIYGGLNWKGSSKISLSAKGGYQSKEYGDIEGMDTGTFSMEAVFDYLISDKTTISFKAYKALEEANSFGDHGMDTTAADLRYEQRFSDRWQGECALHYELNDHTGFVPAEQLMAGDPRKDTTYSIRPSIVYAFRDWLTFEMTYIFENRDSNDEQYNYSTQTIILGLNFAL